MSLKENFFSQLKMHRTFQGKTHVEFSDAIGIAKSSLQSFEAGKGNPTLDTVSVIAKNLDVEEATLLSPPGNVPLTGLDAPRLLLSSIQGLRRLRREKRPEALRLICKITDLFD